MAYPLLGTRIVLDEEKILKEGKYNLEDMYKMIDEYAKESGMIKINKETYHCKGDKYDLGCMALFIYKYLIDSVTKLAKNLLGLANVLKNLILLK
ncbi:hypothetical protein [Campylobacter jejuni]|uniref:hypothetical protein n=1 Tax=Campylobacter jejuni TaxID=197 RepID=UPI0009A1B08D